MVGVASGLVGLLFVVILILGFGIAGGYMAKNDDRSFWLGFAIGLFGNITGLLILAYISRTSEERTFDPNFKDRSNKKLSAIEALADLNEKGKLSDKEFERLKKEIIGERK